LTDTFSVLTRILDGQGYKTDTGAHGSRGYHGDYLFAWLGCTTPFPNNLWKIMSQLGSRLFFFSMDRRHTITTEDLVSSLVEVAPHMERLQACSTQVHEFLSLLFKSFGGPRGMKWNRECDSKDVLRWIARCAQVLVAMRSEREDCREVPYRANAVLYNMARAHALVHGRSYLTTDDMPLIGHVTVSTMPDRSSQIFRAMVEEGKPLLVSKAQAILKAKHLQTIRTLMEKLDEGGVFEFQAKGTGRPAQLCFRPEWEWCMSEDFRELLARR
jgi:hypothetical protein